MTLNVSRLTWAMLAAASIGQILQAQGQANSSNNGNNGNGGNLLKREAMPVQLKAAVDALGSRATTAGNERVTSIGTFTQGNQLSAIQVTREMPDKLRIDYGGPNGRSVGYDGQAPWGSDKFDSSDADMAESLGDASAESILYGLQSGNPLRLIGERFRAKRDDSKSYHGPWLDVFEVRSLTNLNQANSVRNSHVVFDSDSKLLLYVRQKILRGSTPVIAQTEWSGWQKVSGQSVPTMILRRENGAEIWRVTHDRVTVGPAVPDGAFAHK